MKHGVMILLLALVAGCAGPSNRGDNDALERAEARRELERECRIAAQTRTYHPECPEPEYRRAPGPERSPLPSPPEVRLPGR